MQVTEIYSSIQGESSFAGLPCIFVRLTGCNLRCDWCDSEYTFTGGMKMTLDQVVSEIRRLAPVTLLEITGGEPMLQQREVIPLMQQLITSGYTVLLAGGSAGASDQDCGREVSGFGRRRQLRPRQSGGAHPAR